MDMELLGFILALAAMAFAFDADSKVKKLEKRVKELEENQSK